MSQQSGSKKSLAGWTMVDSKGEVMSDDSRSESSDLSSDILSLQNSNEMSTSEASAIPDMQLDQEHDCVRTPALYATSAEEVNEAEGDITMSVPKLDSGVAQTLYGPTCAGAVTNAQPRDEICDSVCHSTFEHLEETGGGLDACCQELMKSDVSKKPDDGKEYEEYEIENEMMDGEKSSLTPDSTHDSTLAIPSPSFLDEADGPSMHEIDSDSDSDYVQINDENFEEFEAELSRNRDHIPSRSPSIGEQFNFLGPAGDNRAALHENHLEEEIDTDDEEFNEETESSTEDITDDRIESDQSDIGTINTLTDVGDLSAFADIGDLPLEAGNVARNYCHRPNNRLSTVLNLTLIVVTILTMGISIGLIMATDLEIEEWQNAYHVQVKKISSLEWTLTDMAKVKREYKNKVDNYDSVLRSLSMAHNPADESLEFYNYFTESVVENFKSCTQEPRMVDWDCESLIQPFLKHSISLLKESPQITTGDSSSYFTIERNDQLKQNGPKIMSKEEPTYGHDHQQQIQLLQQSLSKEQERAQHWQNLYLLERRQREWERENDDLEDKRERALWEKEDEEEDRRERERWKREEEEQDRQERERWEQEDQEEDKRERERWEKERTELDQLECLKKLMSTDLAFLRQHVLKWNTTSLNGFVNMSKLMSGISEMKQSVLTSMQQIWTEAEEALNRMADDVKKGRKSYLDTSVMADYLKQSLAILRSQFDDVIVENMDNSHRNYKPVRDSPDRRHEKNRKPRNEKFFDKSEGREEKSSMWNKGVGKVFKNVGKSLRKFMRTFTTSWKTMGGVWEKKASQLYDKISGKVSKEEMLPAEICRTLLVVGMKNNAGLKNSENLNVDIGSPCLWDVRDNLGGIFVKKSCEKDKYSRACNEHTETFIQQKIQFKDVLAAEEKLHGASVAFVQTSEMEQMFRKFLMALQYSEEILLSYDKTWAFCQHRQWSEFKSSLGYGRKISYRSACSRSVSLDKVLKEIAERKLMEHVRDESTIVDKDEADQYERNDGEKGEENHMNLNSDDGFDQFVNTMDDNTQVYDQSHDDDDDNYNDYYDDDDDNIETLSYSHLVDLNPSEKTSEQNKSKIADKNGRDNGYRNSAWYLKRAQYRIEMRRAQEKSTWFFDMSDHRDEMRKDYNIEKKSAQWLFDQAADRQEQRKKDQQSDWFFERAHHRREEFAKKWSQQHHDLHWHDRRGVKERMKKIKDTFESEWLMQNEGYRDDGNWGENIQLSKKQVKGGLKYVNDMKNKWKGNEKKHQHQELKRNKKHKNKKQFQ